MHLMKLNVLAIVVSAVATMVLGFLWYSPMLFARPWMIAMGLNPDDKEAIAKMQKSAGPMYGMSMMASLLTAAVLAKLFVAMGVGDVLYGLKIAFAVWLGFVMTVQLTNNLFSMKPFKLFLINTGYQLVCYLAIGAILAVWR